MLRASPAGAWDSPKGALRPSCLVLPKWKMATPGRRGEEPESGQPYVGLSGQTGGGGGEGKLVPGQDSLLLGLLSKKVHNGCPTETAQ